MAVTQLSVFLNNEVGRLADATRVLGENGVSVRGFSVAETTDFGIVRLIVDDYRRALDALRKARFTVKETPVVVARVEDAPGGLAKVLSAFAESKINVEYSYAIVKSILAFGVEDPMKAEELLTRRGVVVLGYDDIGGE